MLKRSQLLLLSLIFCLIAALMGACSSNNGGDKTEGEVSQTAGKESSTAETKIVTDIKGRKVEIPSSPKRVVYTDNTVGDILLFGIQPVGLVQGGLENAVYKEEIKDVADVGWPLNVEKLIELQPDIIITSITDSAQIEAISKVAPVLLTNEWDPMADRIKRIGEWFGYEKEAEAFLAKHEVKVTEMWKSLVQDNIIQTDETASVFQYMLGANRLSVYTTSYLPSFIYHENGFKPTQAIQKLIEDPKGYGYIDISAELLPELAGDRIFIVFFDEKERRAAEEMITGPIWRDLPAIKAGKVYFIAGSLGITTDPLAREKLIEDLPVILR
ncbi:ABC transporter substrate-binding protein [Paenibacillus sp. IHBB 10380]|uniref:ABC transporter substrate-binding protein n=1 Tax=Paenibacillus sp. IHBB 10380 TaxID=1566358 RepID=UPI000695F4FE|nr:ABC transporter substrate-binding protein [Paenibacillus sp. IHBB 10380]